LRRCGGSFRRSPSAKSVEDAELCFVVELTGVHGIEIADAIDAEFNGLAVKHKALPPPLAIAVVASPAGQGHSIKTEVKLTSWRAKTFRSLAVHPGGRPMCSFKSEMIFEVLPLNLSSGWRPKQSQPKLAPSVLGRNHPPCAAFPH
jgi:hypothetical protein